MAAILDFRSEPFQLFLIYKSPLCFLPSFESIGLSVQKKKRKVDFQDGHHGGHLGFLIKTILGIFDLQVIPILPTKSFESIGSLVQEKWKIDFQDGCHGGHLGFPIGTILAIFDLQVTQCFLPSLKSISLSIQKKWKIDFQDSHHGSHLGFPIRMILAIFDL